jgi:Methyltransferase domain
MHGTVVQKVGRVMANLCQHPQYISRCLRHNVVGGAMPVDLELPWFAYAAIDFLEEFLEPHMCLSEYGCGGSTLFFARRLKHVCSIENDPQWFNLVSTRLREKSIANVTLKLCPFDFKNPAGFENSDYLRALPVEQSHVVVIDGSEEWTQVRPVCFTYAEEHVRPGGIIVVDDSWRYPDLRKQNRARRVRVFESVGPCRPGVTSTDVYFY